MMRVRSAAGYGQVNFRPLAHFAILPVSDLLDDLFTHQVRQSNVIEEPVDLLAEIIPQFMRQAALALLAVTRTVAARGFNRLINCRDNLGDRDAVGGPTEGVPAARSTSASDEIPPSQAREQLFEVGQRDILPRRDLVQGHRSGLGMEGKIQHRGDGVTSFTGELHVTGPLP
jgi:hypothetical protein